MGTVRDKDKDKDKDRVRVEILIHSVTETTMAVKMGIDNLSGNECSTVTSIIPVIKEMATDIVFNGTLKVNMNNTMTTPKRKTRTRITADNEETIG
jgi:hypothetical protein